MPAAATKRLRARWRWAVPPCTGPSGAEGNLERALSEDPRPGAERKLTGKEEALLVATACATENVGAGIRWICQDTENPRMSQSTPEQFAIPGAAVRPTRKAKTQLLEALDYAVRAALSFE